MAGAILKARVKSEACSVTVRRLETFVSRMERRYECSSEAMLREVSERPSRETREVGKWLAEYSLLTRLRELEAAGDVAGLPSKNTS